MLLCQTVCHRLYSHVSQFIVQSTSLAAICHAVLGRFVNVSRRFEWSQSHQILGQSAYEVCTLQRLRSVGSPLSEPQTSPPPLPGKPLLIIVIRSTRPLACRSRKRRVQQWLKVSTWQYCFCHRSLCLFNSSCLSVSVYAFQILCD